MTVQMQEYQEFFRYLQVNLFSFLEYLPVPKML